MGTYRANIRSFHRSIEEEQEKAKKKKKLRGII